MKFLKYLLIIIPAITIILGIFLFYKKNHQIIIINNYKFKAEIADNAETRKTGLSGRKSIGENEGMLFKYPDSNNRSFWMKEMNFDLDILFISDSVVKEITTLQKPVKNSIPRYKSKEKVNKVLELNAGTCEKLGIKVGDEIIF